MNNFTALEKEVMETILSAAIPNKVEWESTLNALKLSSRSFSSLDKRSCVGFYSEFEENSLLTPLKNIPHNFTVYAKHAELRAGQLGFILFCDETKKGVNVLEGFLYGDDTLPIEEFLKENHSFIVGKPEPLQGLEIEPRGTEPEARNE
jgi:hypothetical protein